MKITITEFRDMIAEAVRRTVQEARKPKEVPPRSEESVLAQRDRQVRALPGYAHGNVLDMSKPLGKRNRTKKQGAANIGGWTSESRGGRPLGKPTPRKPKPEEDGSGNVTGKPYIERGPLDPSIEEPNMYTTHRPGGMPGSGPDARLMNILTTNGVPFDRAQRIVQQFQQTASPQEARTEAVRRLVRMIVREEIRVAR
jgi:hypothetical protein